MKLTMLLDMAAEGNGDRVLVGSVEGGLTGTRLRSLARGGGAALREASATALIYLAENGPCFPLALFSAAYAGVPLVPLNYRLGAEQLQALLLRHPGAIAITDDGTLDQVEQAGLCAYSPQDWTDRAASFGDRDGTPSDETPAVVIYTSGTTGQPKGVILRHDNLVGYVIGSVEFGGAAEDEAALVAVPPYHIAAVANSITNLYAGRRVVVLGRFDPRHWLEEARRNRVSHALVVPTMLARIIDTDGDLSVPTLRALAYGGASMPAHVIEKALRAWPQVAFVNAYGLTETSSTIAVLGPEDHREALDSEDPAVRARLGSAGRPLPSVTVRIRDESGAELPQGKSGRIWVSGPQVSGEYAGTGSTLDSGGFFDTRDDGYLDAEGYLFVGGRTDDTIIRGGENIAPAEIEQVILDHPDIDDAVVVGTPDPEWGQQLEAVVVPRKGRTVDPESVRQLVHSRMRSSKTPKYVHVWDELPRTETGKIVRLTVLARLEAEKVPPAN
jgi:acyl-CoA synthetase (AMP-forming)/AMP-acid ligase II